MEANESGDEWRIDIVNTFQVFVNVTSELLLRERHIASPVSPRAGKNLGVLKKVFRCLGFLKRLFRFLRLPLQSHAVHLRQEYHQEEGLNSCTAMLNVTKIIATPMNSNKFTEFDMKIKNFDLKIKKPKNLTFQVFRFLKPKSE